METTIKRILSFVLALIMVLSASSSLSVQAENTFKTEPMVSAGSHHTVALKSNGTVLAWGQDSTDQLGEDSNVPVRVTGLSDVIEVSAGSNFTLALKNDGTVWAWGLNSRGELGDNTTEYRLAPVQVTNLIDVIAVSTGNSHSLALKSDGTVWAWGHNAYGQLGNDAVTSSTVPVQVKDLTDVVAISAGNRHSLALKSDGTLLAWGLNSLDYLGTGATGDSSRVPAQVKNLTNVIAVSAGLDYSLAIKSDTSVDAWGSNLSGKLGNEGGGTDAYSSIPVQVKNLSDVIAVSAGESHALALRSNGTVCAWGYNLFSQLGDGTNEDKNVPIEISNLTDIISVSAGYYHSMAVKNDGSVWAWGENGEGRLGNGSSNSTSVPTQVVGVNGKGYLNLYTVDFDDVAESDWYYEAIQYVAQKGIMVGKSETMFEPNDILSRAMVATVLYRMAGSPSVTYSKIFTDVPSGDWFSDAIVWAYNNSIVQGYGADKFGTNDSITREQFATMIYRYAGYKRYDTGFNESLSGFTDASNVSSWAKEAMCWSVEKQVITGMTSTTLESGSTATRAQCATILMRFTQNVK